MYLKGFIKIILLLLMLSNWASATAAAATKIFLYEFTKSYINALQTVDKQKKIRNLKGSL